MKEEKDNDRFNLLKNWYEYIENIIPCGIWNLFLFDDLQVKELAELDIPPTVVEAIITILGLRISRKSRYRF